MTIQYHIVPLGHRRERCDGGRKEGFPLDGFGGRDEDDGPAREDSGRRDEGADGFGGSEGSPTGWNESWSAGTRYGKVSEPMIRLIG